ALRKDSHSQIMRYNGLWFLASAVLLAASAAPARANLITDPGFESCTAAGATPTAWSSSGDIACYPTAAHAGNWGTVFGYLADTLSQTITTTPGDNYDFSSQPAFSSSPAACWEVAWRFRRQR